MTREDIDALCELLAGLRKSQWWKVRSVVNDAFESVMKEFYETHGDELEEHGKTPEWFSKRLTVLEED